MIKTIRTDSEHPDFIELVKHLDAYLAEIDGNEHAFYAQFNKIDKIKHVVIAYENDIPLGCGAIKELSPVAMEVKRMYTSPNGRKKGIATTILKELESWTGELGYENCLLETGIRQAEAVSLYKKCGYKRIPNYGQYIGVENSVCFKKEVEVNPLGKICYTDFDQLNSFIQEKNTGQILIDYRLLSDYEGMVLGIGIIFGAANERYALDVEWISFGLDLLGENLTMSYSYQFTNLKSLLDYLAITYSIDVTDIPIKYKIDSEKFPNPFKDEELKPAFEESWARFKQDFAAGKFLDPSLKLVYTSPPFTE
ncbi:N-acetyltransferase [Pedobacter frigiditerrae]|uniref:N-acetyltransferase n=1 Tax=Pedobacter frigiditerrae TaxID=2530452 RepID=A0A4R0MN77_9SPHI|nr:GNAT family N-acetyltransferase [Pedobacter frigiditerrae]TCC88218.1 N-acetyltransferase [Pedobacter frigiditerrae]